MCYSCTCTHMYVVHVIRVVLDPSLSVPVIWPGAGLINRWPPLATQRADIARTAPLWFSRDSWIKKGMYTSLTPGDLVST